MRRPRARFVASVAAIFLRLRQNPALSCESARKHLLPRPAPPSSANLRIFGNGSRALLSSVSNVSGSSRSVARRPRQSARHAAHILICATTKSPAVSAARFERGERPSDGKGDLGSSSVVCRSALIEGRLRGNLHCDDTATINFGGKIAGRISARHIIVERKSDIHCFRRVCAESVEIKGRMSGEIVAQIVTIQKRRPRR